MESPLARFTTPREEQDDFPPPSASIRPRSPIDLKKGPWRQALIQALEALDEEAGEPGYNLVNAAAQVVRAAVAGDRTALSIMGDRLDGKPAQAIAVTGEDGGPLQFADVSDFEVAKRIAFMLSRGVALLPQQNVIEGETSDG